MAQRKEVPIYLLVTDLTAVKKVKDTLAIKSSSRISPYHLALFKHWAIQVRDQCYEVNSRPSVDNPKKSEYFLNHEICLTKWLQVVEDKGLTPERVKVGTTTWSDEEIHEKSELIWRDRFVKKYRLDTKNCQNFSYLLYQFIAVDPDKIKKDVKKIPRRFSDVTHFLKSSITPGIARAILLEYITDGLILGAEAIGLEGVIGLEVLGLEIAGAALLGPIGEVILAATILALIMRKSKDKKWMKKLRKLGKKDKKALETGNVEDQSATALSEQAELVMNEILLEAKSGIADEAETRWTEGLVLDDDKHIISESMRLPALDTKHTIQTYADPPPYSSILPIDSSFNDPVQPTPFVIKRKPVPRRTV